MYGIFVFVGIISGLATLGFLIRAFADNSEESKKGFFSALFFGICSVFTLQMTLVAPYIDNNYHLSFGKYPKFITQIKFTLDEDTPDYKGIVFKEGYTIPDEYIENDSEAIKVNYNVYLHIFNSNIIKVKSEKEELGKKGSVTTTNPTHTTTTIYTTTAINVPSIRECPKSAINVYSSVGFLKETYDGKNQKYRYYYPQNLLEDNEECWCEGTAGYGENGELKFEFNDVYRVDEIKIVNGLHRTSDKERFLNNARVSEMKIEYKNVNGEIITETRRLNSDSFDNAETTIRLSSACTDYIKLTISKVDTSQTIYEDTCITQVSFY